MLSPLATRLFVTTSHGTRFRTVSFGSYRYLVHSVFHGMGLRNAVSDLKKRLRTAAFTQGSHEDKVTGLDYFSVHSFLF
jgi:hypothetical protein